MTVVDGDPLTVPDADFASLGHTDDDRRRRGGVRGAGGRAAGGGRRRLIGRPAPPAAERRPTRSRESAGELAVTGPGRPPPTGFPSTRTIGMISVVVPARNSSSAARNSASSSGRSSTGMPASRASSIATARVTLGRM